MAVRCTSQIAPCHTIMSVFSLCRQMTVRQSRYTLSAAPWPETSTSALVIHGASVTPASTPASTADTSGDDASAAGGVDEEDDDPHAAMRAAAIQTAALRTTSIAYRN